MEAVKQGSISLGCRNSASAVLIGLRRCPDDLAVYQKKIVVIDSHLGIAVSGLVSDARVLSSFMRSESQKERLDFGRNIPCSRLTASVADKAQTCTQFYGGRPYGVGLLIAGHDETGPHVFECLPSGNYEEYLGVAIGSRSQPARTYLERHLNEFVQTDLDGLIVHGLKALQESLGSETKLTGLNTEIGVVGKETEFRVLTEKETDKYLEMLGDGAGGSTRMDIEQ